MPQEQISSDSEYIEEHKWGKEGLEITYNTGRTQTIITEDDYRSVLEKISSRSQDLLDDESGPWDPEAIRKSLREVRKAEVIAGGWTGESWKQDGKEMGQLKRNLQTKIAKVAVEDGAVAQPAS